MHRYLIRDTADSFFIEFLDADADSFFADLMETLTPLAPSMQRLAEPTMDDDYTMAMHTRAGAFEYHKDSWGCAFLRPRTPNEKVARVLDLLERDERFCLVTASQGAP